MDVNQIRDEIKEDFKDLKTDLSKKIDDVNANLTRIIDELKTIADSHTKAISEHSVAISNLILEKNYRPTKGCLDVIGGIVDEKISNNNERLMNAHRDHHRNKRYKTINMPYVIYGRAIALVYGNRVIPIMRMLMNLNLERTFLRSLARFWGIRTDIDSIVFHDLI
jgi:hypothetical protein